MTNGQESPRDNAGFWLMLWVISIVISVCVTSLVANWNDYKLENDYEFCQMQLERERERNRCANDEVVRLHGVAWTESGDE